MISTILKAFPRDAHDSQPRVLCDFATFEEWEMKAEAYYQVEYNHGRSQRSMFDICGQSIAMETYIPWSCFEQMRVVWKCLDFNITKDSDTMKLAEEFKGEWEEGYYAEEGYGWPVFSDALDCWNFIQAWKKRKGSN